MKAIVLLSGGIDSSTCLALAVKEFGSSEVFALNLFYGQRHSKERESAREIAQHYRVQLAEMNLAEIFKWSNCPLLAHSDGEIPKKEYVEQLKETSGKPVSTYVPFRNGLMLSAAASVAVSIGARYVYYGAHADDAAGNAYPDCSVEFTNAINEAIYQGTGRQVSVLAPFNKCNKAMVIKTGLELDVPYRLTWSCYEGGEKPCGKCGTCIDRQKAFEENGIIDPLFK